MSDEMQGGSSGLGRFGKILIYLGILAGVNVLSFVMDWGFWIY